MMSQILKNFLLIPIITTSLFLFMSSGANAAPTDVPPFELTWGSAGSGNSQFNQPIYADVDANGNVYISDLGNARIQVFDENGAFIEAYGTAGSGNGQFSSPQGIAVDDANGWIYVVDNGNTRVQKFDMEWNFILSFTETPTSPGNGTWFNPHGIAVDPATGNVWITLPGEARVDVHDSDGNFLYASTTFSFNAPRSILFYNGEAYVSDQTSNAVLILDPANANHLRTIGSAGAGDGQFNGPRGMAIDYEGYLYVADRNNNRIQKFVAETGAYLAQWGSAGSGNGQFNSLYGFAGSDDGRSFYSTEIVGNRVQKFSFPALEEYAIVDSVTRSENGTDITILFTPISGITDYEICYGISPNNSDNCVEFTITDSDVQNSYVVNGLDQYQSYTFRLRGVGQYSDGPWSADQVLAALAQPTPTLPETGSNLAVIMALAAISIFAVITHVNSKILKFSK